MSKKYFQKIYLILRSMLRMSRLYFLEFLKCKFYFEYLFGHLSKIGYFVQFFLENEDEKINVVFF